VHGIQYVLNSTLGTDWYISSSIVVIKPINIIKHLILFHEEQCTNLHNNQTPAQTIS